MKVLPCQVTHAKKGKIVHTERLGNVKLTVPCNKGKDCIYLKAGTCKFLLEEKVVTTTVRVSCKKGATCPHFIAGNANFTMKQRRRR